MNYYTIAPPPHLSAFVRCFWVFEGAASSAVPYVYRGYADGCPELVFFVKGGFDEIISENVLAPSPTVHLHAQSTTFSRAVTKNDFSIFGCYLYPYAIPAMFGYPPKDFNGRSVELRAFAGSLAAEIEEKVLAAKTAYERVAVAAEYLTRNLMKNNDHLSPVTVMINQMVDRSANYNSLKSIDQLAGDSGLSIRQFERRFKESSGFTPKLYLRILRFQQSLKFLGADTPLSEIALECGYYDQSHFINDFKGFSGYSPKEFFRGNAEGSEYMNIL